jgi:hypothetical protein
MVRGWDQELVDWQIGGMRSWIQKVRQIDRWIVTCIISHSHIEFSVPEFNVCPQSADIHAPRTTDKLIDGTCAHLSSPSTLPFHVIRCDTSSALCLGPSAPRVILQRCLNCLLKIAVLFVERRPHAWFHLSRLGRSP